MIKRKKVMSSFIIALLITSLLHGFVVTPKKDLLIFVEELKTKSTSELETLLEKGNDSESDKVSLILAELGNRADNHSKDLLQKYGKNLKKEIRKSPYYKQPYTHVEMNLAKRKAGGKNTDKYIKELEKLLVSKDQNIQKDIIAYELSETLSPKARDVLLKHENEPDINVIVRLNRLKMDYSCLDDEKYFYAILETAREQIAKGDTRLGAERGALNERITYSTISPLILENELKNPILDDPVYRALLSETYKRIQHSESTYHPKYSELWRVYKERDHTSANQILADEASYYERFGEKAYELLLSVRVEHANLGTIQNKANYLLSKLTGTGDGHSSDYKAGSLKTQEAYENAARVKLLIRFGNSILPIIAEEFAKETKEHRKEALDYIRKQIILSKPFQKEEI